MRLQDSPKAILTHVDEVKLFLEFWFLCPVEGCI